MIASQRKTLSSAFVITAMIVVFCLTATPRALAQDDAQALGGTESGGGADSRDSEGGARNGEHQFSLDKYQFQTLLGLIALAAFLRARIEWIKRQCKHTKTHRAENVLPSAVVETIFAIAGFFLFARICAKALGWQFPACLDSIILGAIPLGFTGLAYLLYLQWKADIIWMCDNK